MFLRRLGQKSDHLCESGFRCPQILELVDGDFAGVGLDITQEAIPAMLPGPGVGPSERVIRIPRKVMLEALADIVVA